MALSNDFKSWFKFYLKECNGTVRGFLYGQISDASKEATGCRQRFDYSETSLVDLSEEAKAWSQEASEVAEREFSDAAIIEHEMAQIAYYASQDCEELAPNQWDAVQDRLERGQLLAA